MPQINTKNTENPPGFSPTTKISQAASFASRGRGPFVILANVECVRESDKAILIWLDYLDNPIWFPRSQISADSPVKYSGDTGDLIITKWILDQKKLTASPPKAASSQGEALAIPHQTYRRLVRKYHPDINPQPYAVEVAKDLNELWRDVIKSLSTKQ